MHIVQCSLAPHLSPRLPVRVRLDPGQKYQNWFSGFPMGFKNDRTFGVSRVQSWGGPACELVGAVRMNVRKSIDMHLYVYSMYFFTNYSSAKFWNGYISLYDCRVSNQFYVICTYKRWHRTYNDSPCASGGRICEGQLLVLFGVPAWRSQTLMCHVKSCAPFWWQKLLVRFDAQRLLDGFAC